MYDTMTYRLTTLPLLQLLNKYTLFTNKIFYQTDIIYVTN